MEFKVKGDKFVVTTAITQFYIYIYI